MNGRRRDDDVNIPAEHDERSTDHGIRFYGVVTLGNLLMVVASIVPILIWGIRLESRVDTEAMLRGRMEVRIDQLNNDQKKVTDRINDQLSRISDGIVDLKLAVVELRKGNGIREGAAKP